MPAMARAAILNSLGLALLRQLSNGHDDILISPLSISACLSMALKGATRDSETEAEMRSLLGDVAPALPENSPIDMANSAWIRGQIRKDYTKVIQTELNAEVFSLQGVNPKPINEWIKEKTEGQIPSLFDALDPLTAMVLVNTVFFKGQWLEPFDPNDTEDSFFQAGDGSRIPCRMMYKKSSKMKYIERHDSQAVSLQYADSNLSATILLPKSEGSAALNDLISSLTAESLAAMLQDLQPNTRSRFRHRPVELRMPRFKVEFKTELNTALKALGMTSAFDKNGGFLQMSDDPQVHISQVMHRAMAQIDEKGTVAAAATGAVVATRSLPRRSIEMTVDRPFLLMITDNGGSLVFLGKISKPILSTVLP
eukprot:TRINITY_DN64197_c0_g1_i1.p1 TRINITY_DN64197_c0_g1~~TRINITY_DN64197_c0_g1_i1.p1  ORF type:complete len:367 (-),score=64.27 TRINITY_DN64197_c0_g1_i1:433-1533(-)